MKTANPGGRPWLKILVTLIVIVVILYFFDIRVILRQISTANFYSELQTGKHKR